MGTDTLQNFQQLADRTVKERHNQTILDNFGEEGDSEFDDVNSVGKPKSLFADRQPAIKRPLLDIGTCSVNDSLKEEKLTSNIKKVLSQAYDIVRLLERAMNEEVNQHWRDAITEVAERNLENANVINSHVVYKVKIEKIYKRMKDRFCRHGAVINLEKQFEKIPRQLNLT